MRVKTTVGQVALVGGNRYDQPRGGLVDERASRLVRGRGRGNLYVLVEVSGPITGRDIVADQLADVVRQVYYEQRGSVTAGLQRALRQANDLLFDENRNSLPGEQWTAGVTCAVLRDTDLFLAQVGPTVAYLAQEGQVSRFPDVSPWLDGLPPEEMDAAALGERRDVNIALFHSQVSAGDTVLLAESELARYVSSQRWPDILSKTSVAAVLDALIAASGGMDLSALVVALGAEEGEKAAAHPAMPAEAAKVPGPAGVSWGEQATQWLEQIQIGKRLQATGRTVAAALAGLWAALLTLLGRMVPGQPGSQSTAGRQTTTVRSAGTRPKKRRRARAADRAQSDPVQRTLIGIAIAIPIIVAIVVLVIVVRRGQTHRAEIEALWQQADAQWQQAQTTTDTVAVRTHLTAASSALDQLLELRPDHVEALELRKRVEVRLDEINQVRRVSWMGELNAYPEDADLSRVVVEGTHIFVMDRRNGRVYHHQLDDLQQALQADSRETVLVSKGDQVGDVLVSDLVDMVWMPAGNGREKANLVILESGGALLEYDPATQELRPLRVAAADTWQFPDLVGSYYGRFYLLDSTANKIWRYQPTPDGYSNLPDDWLQSQVDLAGVEDMAIGDSIYLLYADGNMRKMTAGQPDTFDISDWDTLPRSPTALFTRPPEDTNWIYVADRGNSRIVQTGKEGSFKRQFRLADVRAQEGGDILANVTSLFVDEISGHAYLLSGQKLYLIILPD